MRNFSTNEVSLDPSKIPEEDFFFVKKENNVTIKTDNQNYLGENLKVYDDKDKIEPEDNDLLGHGIDEIIAIDKAVIYEVTETTIKLKLQDGVCINIPKEIFSGKLMDLKYGQDVIYSIKKRKNGQRYQDIDINPEAKVNPYQDKVLDVLSKINYKDEK